MPENLLQHAAGFRLYSRTTENWANVTPWDKLSREVQQLYADRADLIQAHTLQMATLEGYEFHARG